MSAIILPISSPYLTAVSPFFKSLRALKDLKNGDTAVKYGEDIGKIIADIPKGGHVHTHNCKTKRW